MKRILVVDDDPLVLDMVTEMLRSADFEVIAVDNGKDGVRLFHEQEFDLVILDLFMPGLDGFDTMERMDPASKGIPVLAMSARGSSTGAFPLHLARTLGADATLNKSFDRDELVSRVNALLERRA